MGLLRVASNTGIIGGAPQASGLGSTPASEVAIDQTGDFAVATPPTQLEAESEMSRSSVTGTYEMPTSSPMPGGDLEPTSTVPASYIEAPNNLGNLTRDLAESQYILQGLSQAQGMDPSMRSMLIDRVLRDVFESMKQIGLIPTNMPQVPPFGVTTPAMATNQPADPSMVAAPAYSSYADPKVNADAMNLSGNLPPKAQVGSQSESLKLQ